MRGKAVQRKKDKPWRNICQGSEGLALEINNNKPPLLHSH